MSRDQMRAADSDRERAVERLHTALVEGRLALAEFDERSRDVFASRTFGDLDRLLADLPEPAPAERSQVAPVDAPAPPSRHEENPRLPAWLSIMWRAWFVAVSVNLVIWFLVSLTNVELVYFWPIWVAGPWAAVNVGLMILFPPRRRSS